MLEILILFLKIFLPIAIVLLLIACILKFCGKFPNVGAAFKFLLSEIFDEFLGKSTDTVSTKYFLPIAVEFPFWENFSKVVNGYCRKSVLINLGCDGNICSAEFRIISLNSEVTIEVSEKMIECDLRNELIKCENLSADTTVATFVHIYEDVLTASFAISDCGVDFINKMLLNRQSQSVTTIDTENELME